jgi:uncharacterized protein YyaL (SSP411 family)
MHQHTNALAAEKSPYLLQHAHNPVDWLPWGPAAIERARREDKPIFISIGYSTCHWCHVMERESFENEAIAALLNAHFVCVKVDREERPDVDHTFMTAVQAMGQQGGWPLSVWLTPDLKPFFGGTYFPPEERYGRAGFPQLLERIHDLWTGDRDAVVNQAGRIHDALAQVRERGREERGLDASAFEAAFESLKASFDPVHGGFGRAPKFPRPATLLFLLRYGFRTGDPDGAGMVVHTLRRMALGGIHDHLGGGFARYSVDAEWRVPHFEKMAYDQAQLLSAYAQAYAATGHGDLADICLDIAAYLQRDMTAPGGAFFSAEDADSADDNGVSREGAFYVWTREQVTGVVGEEAARVVASYFGFTDAGNFENGRNILHVTRAIPEVAQETGLTEEDVRRTLREAVSKLREARKSRVRPGLDDKVLTSWNGLLISGLSEAAQALDEPAMLEMARRAASFIWDTMWRPAERRLWRRYRDGDAAIEGFLDDYAFLALGMLDLYEASLDAVWLERAVELTGTMLERFRDAEGGLYYAVGESGAQYREDYDGAEPAPTSVAAAVLHRLAEMTGCGSWREAGEAVLKAASVSVMNYPETVPYMLTALDAHLYPPRQVVIAGDPSAEDTRAMLTAVQRRYLPDTTLLLAGDPRVSALAPWTAAMKPLGGKATAYVCEGFACRAPVTDVAALESALDIRHP